MPDTNSDAAELARVCWVIEDLWLPCADLGDDRVTAADLDRDVTLMRRVPPAEPLTGRQFIELAFAAAGRPPRVGTYSPLMLRLVGLVNPIVRELGELAYEFEAPFVLDGAKYLRAFGGAPAPHQAAIRATLGWYADHPKASATPVLPIARDGVAAPPRTA